MAIPSDIAGGLSRWHKADALGYADGTAIDNGANSWTDSAGSGNPLGQATPANRPTLRTNLVNGLPGVRFLTASAHFLTGTFTGTQAQPFTIMVVMNPVSGLGTNKRFIDSTNRTILEDNAGPIWDLYAGSVGNGPAASTGWQVLICHFNGASSSIRLNGVSTNLSATISTNGLGGATWTLGSNISGTDNVTADIAEVAIWPKDLSSVEDAQMDSYVQDKYAITVADYVASGATETRHLWVPGFVVPQVSANPVLGTAALFAVQPWLRQLWSGLDDDVVAAGGTQDADGALTATGTLTADAATDKPVTAAATATGTLSATATSTKPVDAALVGTGALTGTAASTKPVDATLAATGTLTATATVTAAGKNIDGTLAGTGTLTATASSTKPVDATRTGTGTLTATGATDKPVQAALAGTGTLTGTSAATKPVDAVATATGTLTATGASTKPVQATLAGTGTLTATATVTAAGKNIDGALVGVGTLTGTATATKPADGGLVGMVTASASMTVVKPLTATLTATATATATATLTLLTSPGQMYPAAAPSATMTPAAASVPEMDPRVTGDPQMSPGVLATSTMSGG